MGNNSGVFSIMLYLNNHINLIMNKMQCCYTSFAVLLMPMKSDHIIPWDSTVVMFLSPPCIINYIGGNLAPLDSLFTVYCINDAGLTPSKGTAFDITLF